MAVGCRTCGKLNPDGAAQCQYCGAALAAAVYQDPFVHQRPQPQQGQQMAEASYAPPGVGFKDPGTGLLLEMIPGFFGFMGVGYLWAGEVGLGLAIMVGYWLFWGAFAVLAVLTLGLLLCLLPIVIPLYIAAPIVSGIMLQRRLQARLQMAAPPTPQYPHPY